MYNLYKYRFRIRFLFAVHTGHKESLLHMGKSDYNDFLQRLLPVLLHHNHILSFHRQDK